MQNWTISCGLVSKSFPTLATPGTVACQAPLYMEFPMQEYWRGLLFPSPGELLNLGIKLESPALQADSLATWEALLSRQQTILCIIQ